MKVLWFCNMLLPKISSKLGTTVTPYGGWLTGISEGLVKNTQVFLTVACPGTIYSKGALEEYNYVIYNSKDASIASFIDIITDIEPDIIHVFGTEYYRSLDIIIAAKNSGYLDRTLISIQGLVSYISKEDHYFAGLPFNIINRWTFGDILRRRNIKKSQESLRKLGANEEKTIKIAKHVIGRTEWDYACTKLINPNITYHVCNEILRDEFYKWKWDINSIEHHSIFVSQGNIPIKGFHKMLEAFCEVLKVYPDAHLYTTGESPVNVSLFKRIQQSSYKKYIKSLIQKNHLVDKVSFLGVLNEKEMCNRYLRSNVFVCTSSIENSPNSLGEAMLLGVPCVAADVGGVKSLIQNDKEGYVYPFNESYMLAHYIIKIFESDDIAEKFSKEAYKHARITHDSLLNTNRLLDIYMSL